MKPILIIGEINVDLIFRGYQSFPKPGIEVLVDDFILTLGSASAICAVGLAKLGNRVSFLGKVGDDSWGRYCLDAMAKAGVDVSLSIVDPKVKTGVTASISSEKDRALVTYLGSILSLGAEDIDTRLFERFGHLHISSLFLQKRLQDGCAGLFARAKQMGLTTSLDPGFDPEEKWDLKGVQVDVFFPNEVELKALSGKADPVEGLKALDDGRTRTVGKLGADGAIALEGKEVRKVPAYPVQPVDTTGAGDSFNAGFLHGYVRKWPLVECLKWGAACGALSTRALGGTGSQASADEVERLIGGR